MNRATLLMPLSMAVMVIGIVGYVLTPTQPLLQFGVFVLTMVVVGMAGWLISDRPGPDPLDVRVMDAALISLTFMALSVLLLGSAGMLGWWMLVVSAGMAGSMWAMFDRRIGFDRRVPDPRQLSIGGLTVFALALGSFAAVQAVLGRLFRPPVGDPLAYHLPFVVEWLQRGTLVMPVPAAGDPSPPFYPLNSSVWTFWLLAPFESEILARFVQLPFLGLLALGTYRLGREVRLSSTAAAMAAVLAISVPAIARSASLAENDLIVAALLVMTTAYLTLMARRFTVWRAGMTAVVIGLMVGTKVIALAFGSMLGGVWLALVIRGRRPEGFGPTSRLLAAGAVIVVIVGGYGYIRNLIVMGNPLYPAGYELPGGLILDGLYFPTWEWRQNHVFFQFDWESFLFGSRREFGWTVTVWAIPGVILAALLSGIGAFRKRREWLGFVLAVWVAVSLLIYWYVIPYHFSRFLFATIVIAVVAGMWGLGRVAAYSRLTFVRDWHPALAVPIIAVNLINIPLDPSIRYRVIYWLEAAVVIGGVAAALVIARVVGRRRLRLLLYSGTIVGGFIAIIAWPFYLDEYNDRRIERWQTQMQDFSQDPEAWDRLESETAGAQSVIAVAGTNEIYPLYGPDLENRIITIWHSGELAKFDWGNPFVYFGDPNKTAWEEQIWASEVDYVVMTEDVSFGGWPVERDWILASPELYRLVFSNEQIEIWEVTGIPGESARYTVRREWINQSEWQAD